MIFVYLLLNISLINSSLSFNLINPFISCYFPTQDVKLSSDLPIFMCQIIFFDEDLVFLDFFVKIDINIWHISILYNI